MKIHDLLIYELIKPDKSGKPMGEIIKIVGTARIEYGLEQSIVYHDFRKIVGVDSIQSDEMSPDIVVTRTESTPEETKVGQHKVVIEVETDVDFDFGASLRQVNRYRIQFADVRVIIPSEYEKFAPLYKNEGFGVYLWKAIRKWQCSRCGNETEKVGRIPPKCKKCRKRTEHTLVGLEDTHFTEFL